MKGHTSYLIYLKEIATEKGLNLFWVIPDMGVGTNGESFLEVLFHNENHPNGEMG